MAMQELTIMRREGTGKEVAKRLRRAGTVPAVLYGGAQAETIAVNPRDVLRVMHGSQGSTQLLSLRFEGDGGQSRMAIIRALQYDPVTESLLHVDLQEVSADRAITIRVAVHPVGEAVGVKEQKGILNLVVHELDVSCLPSRIPERLDVDVTSLRIGDVFTVASVPVPEGVRILNDPGQAIVTVSPPMAEETPAAAAPAAAAVAEPEVLTERKPKEEAEDGGKEAKKAKK